jgi:hypothetical protein
LFGFASFFSRLSVCFVLFFCVRVFFDAALAKLMADEHSSEEEQRVPDSVEEDETNFFVDFDVDEGGGGSARKRLRLDPEQVTSFF